MTARTLFERLYLVIGLVPLCALNQLSVCSHSPTVFTPAISRFLFKFFWGPLQNLLARSLSSMSITHFFHGGKSVETTHHCALLPLVDTNTHQHGKAGTQNCDAAPPTQTAACHFVLACETGVVHARCCARHRARCTHGTHACAWHTHAPPICSSAALAALRCRDLSSAALLCGPHGERA